MIGWSNPDKNQHHLGYNRQNCMSCNIDIGQSMRGGSTIWINGLSLMCNNCFISACRNLSSPACSLFSCFHHHPHLHESCNCQQRQSISFAKTHSWNTKLSTPPLLVPHHRLEIPDLTSIQGEEHRQKLRRCLEWSLPGTWQCHHHAHHHTHTHGGWLIQWSRNNLLILSRRKVPWREV